MKYSLVFASGLLLALGGCSVVPPSAYGDRAKPDSLIDVAVEQVTVPLDRPQGLDDLVAWLDQSEPYQAMLQCATNDMLCINARRTLTDYGVPFSEQSSPGGNQVLLVYERIAVRDCNQTYVDQPHNPYNLNHDAYGCSVVGNALQMVTDKRQFVNPQMLGYMDGTQAVKIYDDYLYAEPDAAEDSESLLDDLGSE